MMIEIKNHDGITLHRVDADTLCGANLCGVNLYNANLYNANLENADLCYANLYNANLYNANLYSANLRGAYLCGANLENANLRGAYLCGAMGIISLGQDPRGYCFYAVQQKDGWRILAGCRWFTIPEAIEHWTKKRNKDALARLALAAALTT